MTPEISAPSSIEEITPKMQLKGVVKKIELYGALVDVGVSRPGLLHISQLSEGHVKNVTDVLNEGDEVTVWVRDVDQKKGRIGLTMLKPPAVTWNEIDTNKVYTGEVVRLEKFGAFVDIGAERPGLVHVSELATSYVGDPKDIVNVGDELQVKVIGVNRRKKQIDLSVRALEEPTQSVADVEEEAEDVPTAMEVALRRAMENSGVELPPPTKGKGKRRKKNKNRAADDIFARTLQEHMSND